MGCQGVGGAAGKVAGGEKGETQQYAHLRQEGWAGRGAHGPERKAWLVLGLVTLVQVILRLGEGLACRVPVTPAEGPLLHTKATYLPGHSLPSFLRENTAQALLFPKPLCSLLPAPQARGGPGLRAPEPG